MGRIWLIVRLVGRDLRYRPGPAVLLVLAITAATATLALGLALHNVTNQPYLQTRAATKGPDVVARIGGPGRGAGGPAVPGTLLGIPLGIELFAVAAQGAGVVVPPVSWLAVTVLGTLVAVAMLAAIPASIGALRPVSPVLQAESA